MRFAPEGLWLAGPIAAVALVVLILGLTVESRVVTGLGIASGLISIAVLLFFRDPTRYPPVDSHLVVSPADGCIIEADTLSDGRKHVAVFLSVFNVHVNRAPISGLITGVTRTPGTYFHAGSSRAASGNARVDVEAETTFGPVRWRQLSGAIARKISCRLRQGDRVGTGDRFGLIYFGSRMDVNLPSSARLLVQKGVKVRAGETVIATFEEI